MEAYRDPKSEGNSEKYRTGKNCIVDGCFAPAGTAWGPYWCIKHNIERIEGINISFENIRLNLKRREVEVEK